MSMQPEPKTIAVVLLLVIFVGAIASGIIDIPILGTTALMDTGLTVLSISSTKVISNDADISTANFIITAVASGADNIVGYITPGEFDSKSGYETEYPLEMGITTTDEVLSYPVIRESGSFIYNIEEKLGECGILFAPACPTISNDGVLIFEVSAGIAQEGCGFGQVRNYCFYEKQIGLKGHLDAPTVSFQSDMYMKVNGERIDKSISSQDRNVIFESNGEFRASVTWVGSLTTGDPAPSEAAYVTVYEDAATTWKVNSQSRWDNYRQKETEFNSILNSIKTGGVTWDAEVSAFRSAMATMNSYATQLTDTEVSITGTEGTYPVTWINRASETSAKATITVDRRITVPEFRITVAADWVGVKISVGKPQISNLNCDEIKSGLGGNINLDVKNTASSPGVFAVSITDCPTFITSFSSLSNEISLDGGETGSMNIQITGGTSALEVIEECTVKVYDTSNSNNFDTANVECTLTPPELCLDGEQTILSNCIHECVNEKWTEKECCEPEEEVKSVDGEFKCVDKETGKPVDTNDWLFIIKIVLSLIVFIFIYKTLGAGFVGIFGGLVAALAVWMVISMSSSSIISLITGVV